MKNELRAPKFRAYLDRKKHALIMKRSDWIQLRNYQNKEFILDITKTPIANIRYREDYIGSFAELTCTSEYTISVIRNDVHDEPNPINIYEYEVWEKLENHINYYKKVVTVSDTTLDDSLLSFIGDYVFLIPKKKGRNHHLPEIPAIISLLLNKCS